MNKNRSNSSIKKSVDISPVLKSNSRSSTRINSVSTSSARPPVQSIRKCQKNFPKSLQKPLKSAIPTSLKSKENCPPDSKMESMHLLNTLKSYVFKPSKELNLILKEIPKYTARKIQDLKKGYKYNENFNFLATSFLSLFGEMDEELGKEIRSLRKKIGEIFTGYLANSGRFIKLLKCLPETLKKNQISQKQLGETWKALEAVDRSKLSSNYQDLYEFIDIIIGFFEKHKNLQRPFGNRSSSNGVRQSTATDESFYDLKDIFGNSYIFKTYDKAENTNLTTKCKLDTSLSEIASKTYNSSNSSLFSLNFLENKKKTIELRKRSGVEIFKIDENLRSSSPNLQKPNPNPEVHSKSVVRIKQPFDSQKSLLKHQISEAKRKEWEEIRINKKQLEIDKQKSMNTLLQREKIENERFQRLVKEKEKKEREEIKKFRQEEFFETKRIKSLQEIQKKKEIEDDLKRNLEKSRVSRQYT